MRSIEITVERNARAGLTQERAQLPILASQQGGGAARFIEKHPRQVNGPPDHCRRTIHTRTMCNREGAYVPRNRPVCATLFRRILAAKTASTECGHGNGCITSDHAALPIALVNLTHAALWLGAIALIVAGFMATIVPGLPGVLVIYGGMWLAAWIDDFTRMGWPTLTILGVLAALALAAELIASAVGAKRVGASRLALIGSLIGGVAGIPFGLLGLVTGPFLGAVAGELIARRRLLAAARVGFGTWVGLAFGTLIKLALAVSMLGVFAVSYWL
jgi:uncharacterized protein YqgC (DUF456 family)